MTTHPSLDAHDRRADIHVVVRDSGEHEAETCCPRAVPVDTRPAILRFVERINQHAGRVVERPHPVWQAEDVVAPRSPALEAPDRMDTETKVRLRTAAERAKSLYPGPVGELLNQELLSWMVFGHLLGSTLIIRLADDLLTEPITRGPACEAGPFR